jgi:multidrug resistance efflux pump
MIIGLVITTLYSFFIWLIFFKLKWLKFSITWGVVSGYVGLHLTLIFLLGMRYDAPYSTNAKVIQHTIQLVPRLPEPTLVTAVLVEANVTVKKGQPLFQFDRRPYEFKVKAVQAQLAAAEQHVPELKAELDAAVSAVALAKAQRNGLKAALDAASATVVDTRAKRELAWSAFQIEETLAKADAGAISKLRLDQGRAAVAEIDAATKVALANEDQARVAFQETAEASIKIALAKEAKARLAFESEINGENTTVAKLQADLAQAQYYLDNTTMVAPEDGRIVNLQVRAGMVSGIIRYGAIASFIVDADRYVLATYVQENLKWVESGQSVDVALYLYPGQIFKGKVKHIWRASGEGQLLPSGEIPTFNPLTPQTPQGQFAVQIVLDDEDQQKFPIGAQGTAAIYVGDGGFAALRRVGIRAHTWLNWLYPLPF